jgi:hypothetical protein
MSLRIAGGALLPGLISDRHLNTFGTSNKFKNSPMMLSEYVRSALSSIPCILYYRVTKVSYCISQYDSLVKTGACILVAIRRFQRIRRWINDERRKRPPPVSDRRVSGNLHVSWVTATRIQPSKESSVIKLFSCDAMASGVSIHDATALQAKLPRPHVSLRQQRILPEDKL